MSVWDDLVGQDAAIATLRHAVGAAAAQRSGETATGMTHAWLFTGPPGSGRSTAARAFAAALECPDGGCGQCPACRTAVAGSHADVNLLTNARTQLTVDVAREGVRQAALVPAVGRWQVMIVEDADRLNDSAANALLKSIEEPPVHTVWLLCAPTIEDVVSTIRSRCRSVTLRTPRAADITHYLTTREQVPESVASFAARASQGHIGRARALALDEATRNRRREALAIPAGLRDLGACLEGANTLVAVAEEEAEGRAAQLFAAELADLETAYGVGTKGVRNTEFTAAKKRLEHDQKQRRKRLVRDSLDRSLLDLSSFYRDVLMVQLGSDAALVNAELRAEVDTLAHSSTAEDTLRGLTSISETREVLSGEIAPGLALESLMISLSRQYAGADR